MRLRAVQGVLTIVLLALIVGTLAGCAARAPSGSGASMPDTHVVQRNETLYRIAQRYGLEWRDLARRNAIDAPYLIHPGQRLRLRGAARSSPPSAPQASSAPSSRSSSSGSSGSGSSSSSGASSSTSSSSSSSPSSAPADPGGWQWPADGQVLRGFSSSGTRRGLAIGGERGDNVRATRAGEVVYAGGGLVGYGRLVILKHDARFLSAYGHNDELLVSEGDRVQAGDTIARLGSSGAERPMLHFEIRVDGTPVDPTRYLPDR
ncbi:peptidoglycan DD-metalloendopeptidase family protein [Thioalkalivibrio sp. ALE17]|uniref:peptidoglycan DD-metalloendopeptidase family protein n=1 Tax=Thioalkalivibrio sp. ALE17 TaxID=1158173 RepID=UPI00048C1552|nr:peptidoglycan DD-metalloendopeptidase family protein [Thioalkalivibrio sp. ALE17]